MAERVISLGERLKHRRTELGLSQSQAARELEVARSAYRLWEMEAARPSPDRWRLIARWLGVSVATMLLAAELIDQGDSLEADSIALRLGPSTEWDDATAVGDGDFFEQERAMIARQRLTGVVSGSESDALGRIVDRLQSAVASHVDPGWRRGVITKELAITPASMAAARAAVLGVAAGIPADKLDVGVQLTSELVADVVRRRPPDDDDIATLHVSVTRNQLRVRLSTTPNASDVDPPAGDEAEWSMRFMTRLASRWGAGTEGDSFVRWFDVDLAGEGRV